MVYCTVHSFPKIHKEFEGISKDYFNDVDIKFKLYDYPNQNFETFKNKLNDIIYPIYKSAENCGFLVKAQI